MIRIRKILKSIVLLGIIGLVVLGVTNAFFSDTETSKDNILAAGELDLKVDNTCYYNGLACRPVLDGEDKPLGYSTWSPTGGRGGDPNGERCSCTWDLKDLQGDLFFDFNDLKPDDESEDTISLHVKNDAYACMSIKKTEDDDETCSEPEQADDPTCNESDADLADGELGGLLQFIFWEDDGDNVLEDDEKVFKKGSASSLFDGAIWTLADSLSNIWTGVGGPLLADTDYFIGKAWCFGTQTEDPVPSGQGVNPTVDPGVDCDGTALNNAAQTDLLMADIEFSAVQARHNSGFLCEPPEVTVTPKPTDVACIPGFATGVASSAQGLRKNGTAVLLDRSDTGDALGAPQSTGNPSDTPVVAGSFFSLGFGTGNVGGGNIILTFANPIVDLAGFDFRVFEVTGGTYPDEKIKVEASQNGVNFFDVTPIATRDQFMDLGTSGLAWASHLRITDQSDKSLFEDTADAYDLDGVQTFCGTVPFE